MSDLEDQVAALTSQIETLQAESANQGDEKKSSTVPRQEICETLNIGKNGYYSALAQGQIPSLLVNKRRIVPRPAWEKWLASAGDP